MTQDNTLPANITGINIEDEMKQSYLDYAMSVIIGRALPDVRDGLKPVQRRVLYAMFTEGHLSSKKTSKCAGVVGQVLKKLHPHGDSSVYEALVRLAQPWNLRYPVIYGQGNFGSIDGDPPAAYRYTECKLTAQAESLLADIHEDTVDHIANFDDTEMEPTVLPCRWPNLLVNGSGGIAVGMATRIPPHNLTEVINACIEYLKNTEITVMELMKIVPGPDFPTGGTILGRAAIRKAYMTGRGIIKIAAKTHVEKIKRKASEVEGIIITEIPYQVNKARLQEKIANLVNAKMIEGISAIRDESDRKGMRLVIQLKKGVTPEVVLSQLYKMTPLRSSFGINTLAIVEGKPQTLTLKDLIVNFINHRTDVVSRRTQFRLNKAEKRMHILEGFKIALINLDEVIELIKSSDTPTIARTALIQKYSLSLIQAQAILELRLQKLTGMERLAIEKEHAELAEYIKELMDILGSPSRINTIIQDELIEIRDKFGDERRTVIEDSDIADDIDMEDLIEQQEMVVTVSHKGYAKRTYLDNYKAQKRGGKGVKGAASKDEDDFIEHLFVASTHDYIFVITNFGRLYWLKVYNIPEGSKTARGRALVNLLNLKEDEHIAEILPVKTFSENYYLTMLTEKGIVKKTDLMKYSKPRNGGIVAIKLNEGDKLINARISTGSDYLLIGTSSGMSIRFNEENVRAVGRASVGVRGIKISDDKVVGMAVISSDINDNTQNVTEEDSFLTVTENGYGKRTKISEYRAQNRGGKGVIDIKTDSRNGSVAGVCGVNDNSQLMIITSSGKIIRFLASDVSMVGRNTKGVRLINLDADEKVLSVARLSDDNSSDDESEDEDSAS